MNRNISEINGTIQSEPVGLYGEWVIKVFRADGTVEERVRKNQVTYYGMNRLAARGVVNAPAAGVCGSAAAYVVVGTSTSVPSYTDTQSRVGEVLAGRKLATIVQSREWMALTNTFGGASDSLTGIALDSAAISDYASSADGSTGAGSGSIIFNRVNGIAVTLAQSDILNLTVRIRVGSHDSAHSF